MEITSGEVIVGCLEASGDVAAVAFVVFACAVVESSSVTVVDSVGLFVVSSENSEDLPGVVIESTVAVFVFGVGELTRVVVGIGVVIHSPELI